MTLTIRSIAKKEASAYLLPEDALRRQPTAYLIPSFALTCGKTLTLLDSSK